MTDSTATILIYISVIGLLIAFGGMLVAIFKSKFSPYKIIGAGAIIFLVPMLLIMMGMVLESIKVVL